MTYLEIILTSENVERRIRENLNYILDLIPEIKAMIDFPHNHPHHHLDVFEHTLNTLKESENDLEIRLTLLLHDIGKPHSYQDGVDGVRHFKGHPEMSANITKYVLKRLGYEDDYITYICEIISRHDTPLTEENIVANIDLSKVIFNVQKCDALAHNPAKNKKRLEYIETITKFFKEKEKTNESVSIM